MKICLLPHGPKEINYATAGSAGIDLSAAISEPLLLAPGARTCVPTGIMCAIPEGFEGQVRPRSGLALKKGLTVLNTPGTIDEDYRGEIKVILINFGQEVVEITPQMRIAQLVISPYKRVNIQYVETLDVTQRNAGGFGSTGV